MKYSLKVFLSTICITALTISISGYYLIESLSRSALNREVDQAIIENSLLRRALEITALNTSAPYERLQDGAIAEMGNSLDLSGVGSERLIRISGENGIPIYGSKQMDIQRGKLSDVGVGNTAYQIIAENDRFYIQTAGVISVLNRVLYLETFRDITVVFQDKDSYYGLYRRAGVLLLLAESIVIYLLSLWLTKPIESLSAAARSMAGGDYGCRAEKTGDDELGKLTQDFNTMAGVLEAQIKTLQDAARVREDFVAAVTHELKTPLTAIIGYADFLRSYKVDEEQLFTSADYIYHEGKRLEALSLKLLDLIVLRHQAIQTQAVAVSSIERYLDQMFGQRPNLQYSCSFEKAVIEADPALIKTVLVNLIDNGIKAAQNNPVINVSGVWEEGGYLFSVKDNGQGIPEAELQRITEAFYMIDKSRTKSKDGAGVGLALCAEILALHGSRLEFKSKEKEGTTVSFLLKTVPGEVDARE